MKKIRIAIALLIVMILALPAVSFADYLGFADVRYDSRYYPEMAYQRGGAEGHSGAYVQIVVGIVNYYDLADIVVTAEHKGANSGPILEPKFEVSLKEINKICVGEWPYPEEADQWFTVHLKPSDWMVGNWTITLKYTTMFGDSGKEERSIFVPRFNYPPEPTGIQISEYNGRYWIAWNSLGAPGTFVDGKHVEYRILKTNTLGCLNETYVIRPGAYEYQMWSGNRIAVPVPEGWNNGDYIRVENRVYDNFNGVYRYDRAVRYFNIYYMPWVAM